MNTAFRQGIVAVSTLLALTALPAMAGPHEAGRGGRHGDRGGFGRLLPPDSYLDLTAEQKTAVDRLREETKAKVQPLFESQREKRQALRSLLDGAKPDALAVGNLTIEMHQTTATIRTTLDAAKDSFVALLNAEQKVKYDNFRELREDRRDERRERRAERRGHGDPADDGGN